MRRRKPTLEILLVLKLESDHRVGFGEGSGKDGIQVSRLSRGRRNVGGRWGPVNTRRKKIITIRGPLRESARARRRERGRLR
eukprot:2196035-Prymnesium_polylepis.1